MEGFAEFSGEANSTIVDDAGHGQSRQTTSVAMQLGQASEVEVFKTLMPEHCESRAAKTADQEIMRCGR